MREEWPQFFLGAGENFHFISAVHEQMRDEQHAENYRSQQERAAPDMATARAEKNSHVSTVVTEQSIFKLRKVGWRGKLSQMTSVSRSLVILGASPRRLAFTQTELTEALLFAMISKLFRRRSSFNSSAKRRHLGETVILKPGSIAKMTRRTPCPV